MEQYQRPVWRGIPLCIDSRARKIIDVETLLYVTRRLEEIPRGPVSDSIREATAVDVTALTELAGEGRWWFQRLRRRRRIARRFTRGDTCLVYELPDASLAGCNWLGTGPLTLDRYHLEVRPGAGEAYQYGLLVRASERRAGVGVALIDAMREHARANRILLVGGHISPRNPATPHIFLTKRGHRIAEEVRVLVLMDRWGLTLRRRKISQTTSSATVEQIVV